MKSGNLSRRIMTMDGWFYFCNVCGTYKSELDFYRRKRTNYGLDSRCKLHYKKNIREEKSMQYLNLHAVKPADFEEAQGVLERLGYNFCEGCPSVHEQFMEKHQSKWGNKN